MMKVMTAGRGDGAGWVRGDLSPLWNGNPLIPIQTLRIYSIFSGIGKEPVFHSEKLEAWTGPHSHESIPTGEGGLHVITLFFPKHFLFLCVSFSLFQSVGIFVHMCAIFEPTSRKHCKGFKVEIKHLKHQLLGPLANGLLDSRVSLGCQGQ